MSLDNGERTFVAIMLPLIVIALASLITWGVISSNRMDHARRWGAHCVCSQQTCFQAPDGGWRQ